MNVRISQVTIRRISSGLGTMPSRMIPNALISRTTSVSTRPMTDSTVANFPLIPS